MKERESSLSPESQKACYKRISQSITDHRSQREKERERKKCRLQKEGRHTWGPKRDKDSMSQRTNHIGITVLARQAMQRERERERERERRERKRDLESTSCRKRGDTHVGTEER